LSTGLKLNFGLSIDSAIFGAAPMELVFTAYPIATKMSPRRGSFEELTETKHS
jgi:hypothetical protein